jgi:hypothetical protein
MKNTELTKIKLERLLDKHHIEAGKLLPHQHVYTIEGVRALCKAYGIQVGKVALRTTGKPKWKRDKIYSVNSDLLDPSIDNYKKLNKTP